MNLDAAMVQIPQVENVYNDQTRGVRYEVLSYRPLTEGELILAVRMYLSQTRTKRQKRGTVVQITSIIGYND